MKWSIFYLILISLPLAEHCEFSLDVAAQLLYISSFQFPHRINTRKKSYGTYKAKRWRLVNGVYQEKVLNDHTWI